MARKSAPEGESPKKRTPAKKAGSKRAPSAKKQQRGSSAAEERGAHNPDVGRSTRPPATKRARSSAAERGNPAPRSRGSKAPRTKENARDAEAGGSIPSARHEDEKPRQGGATAAHRAKQPGDTGSTPESGSTSPPTDTAARLMSATPRQDPKPDAPLTMAEEAFVTEYLRNGGNGTAAWMFSHPGCTPAAAAVNASKALRRAKVASRILAARQQLAAKFEMDRERVLSEWLAIYTADPNELMQIRAVACGACWGGVDKQGQAHFIEPDPDCECCAGEGNKVPWLADTRNLSPAARRLYAGYKVTRDGVQILMHDKERALENIGRILGVYERDNEQQHLGLVEAARQFFAGLQDRRLPVVKTDAPAPALPPAHPLVRVE